VTAGRARTIGWALLLLSCVPGPMAAASEVPAPFRIRPGAIGVGLSGSLIAVEGSTHGAIAVRSGVFLGAGPGTLGLELEPAYVHIEGLDIFDLQVLAVWQLGIASTSAHAFAGLGGGVRQEWLGSFRQARYPVGLQFGMNALVSRGAGVRMEYRYRRVLDDPVADYDEHQVFLGISLFLRNQ